MARKSGILQAAFVLGMLLSAAVWLNRFDDGEARTAEEMRAESGAVADGRQAGIAEAAPSAESVDGAGGSGSGGPQGEAEDKPPQSNEEDGGERQSTEKAYRPPYIRVYLSEAHRVETVSLEAYVRGVVAAEMPAGFEPAALEAQAMAARTYIVRRLLRDDRSNVPVKAADVTDTVAHQAYKSKAQMNRLRADDPEAWSRIDGAVRATAGQVIVYDDEPIEALYFAASNGYTENSEDVFPDKLPYLRSVASPWDAEAAPDWETTTELSVEELYAKLGIRPTAAAIGHASLRPAIRVVERTEGGRVKTLKIGSKSMSGADARAKLGLRSAAFEWTIAGDRIAITAYGNGHGVGMSQWGAQGMAREGRTAEEIIRYYYEGADVMEASKLAAARTNRT